jgi:hypothetical protein
MALCLRALSKPAEAASLFDEALDEGKETLKPETRAAIERELAELSKVVATVNLSVITEDKKPIDSAVISIEPAGERARALAPGAQRRPIRLMPGIYTFTARAPGYPDPPAKKLALVSGAPIDAAFVVGTREAAGEGTLTVRASVATAKIRIDGIEVSEHGTWSGKIASGTHKLEVAAPGWKTTTLDVALSPGASVDYPVTLQAFSEAPPEYVAPPAKPIKEKKLYVVPMLSLDTASYRLGVPLEEPAPYGTRRGQFVGGTVGGRIGYRFAKTFSIEALADVGKLTDKYRIRATDPGESQTSVSHWQLTPMLRFATPGKYRFTVGSGFGLSGVSVDSTLSHSGPSVSKKGSGVGFSWLIDAGAQLDLGPVFLEAAVFLDIHSVVSVRDDDPQEGRFLYASPATRAGLRAGLGIPF